MSLSVNWCGRRDSNPHDLSVNRFSYHFDFRRRRYAFVVWTIPSPWLTRFRCCPSSLYTFPIVGLGSGLASAELEAFPEFEQFYSWCFPQGTQFYKSVVYTSSTTSASCCRNPATKSHAPKLHAQVGSDKINNWQISALFLSNTD